MVLSAVYCPYYMQNAAQTATSTGQASLSIGIYSYTGSTLTLLTWFTGSTTATQMTGSHKFFCPAYPSPAYTLNPGDYMIAMKGSVGNFAGNQGWARGYYSTVTATSGAYGGPFLRGIFTATSLTRTDFQESFNTTITGFVKDGDIPPNIILSA